MDLIDTAIEELALEGLEGSCLSNLWKLLEERQPPINNPLDQWTKPYIWKKLVECEHVQFYYLDYNGKKQDPPLAKKKALRLSLTSEFWIVTDDHIGYSQTFSYRVDVKPDIVKDAMSLEDAENRWGGDLIMVICQQLRQRILFGKSNSPVNDDITPIRYIMLELIGKTRWKGFHQSDFRSIYGLDPRSSFHHVKILNHHHMITKQTVNVVKSLQNITLNCHVNQVIPNVMSTKIIHLSWFSNISTKKMHKSAFKVCQILAAAPDQIMERAHLRNLCRDIHAFKKVRQWLFHQGYINYIVNGKVWKAQNLHQDESAHFRASKPCYVNLVNHFEYGDVDDDKDDDFLDYIDNCDDIDPQLVYEETLHHQAFQIIGACKDKGISVKKLAEIMCIPHHMTRSIIRYFDSNKVGRMINEEVKKMKVQRIVDIRYLHMSETVQKLKSNITMFDQHMSQDSNNKSLVDDQNLTPFSVKQHNLELADNINLVRVSERSKVSLRHLSRQNFILEALKKKPVIVSFTDLYRGLLEIENNEQGLCCRKTLRKIVKKLAEDGKIRIINLEVDKTATPPTSVLLYCAHNITEESKEFIDASETLYKRVEDRAKRMKTKEKKSPEHDETDIMTDTDDECNGLKDTKLLRSSCYGRFRKLQVIHYYLWKTVYGVEEDPDHHHSISNEDTDLIQCRYAWFKEVGQLSKNPQGDGWFNIGEVISKLPLHHMVNVIGIRYKSETLDKFMKDPKRRFMPVSKLPPRLKHKLVDQSRHVDILSDILVFLSQMGLIAVHPTLYPVTRTELMLFLRREAKILDTRCSEKNYCHTILPEGIESFPETVYKFNCFADVEKYWTDLHFICLNTPLGVTRQLRKKFVSEKNTIEEGDEHKKKGQHRIYRSYTVLRDFQEHYVNKDFSNMEPVLFGNSLGAGGLDSIFFGHLPKNWAHGKVQTKTRRFTDDHRFKYDSKKESLAPLQSKKIFVSNSIIKLKKGGKGLKRKLSVAAPQLSKKEKIERQLQYDLLMSKRYEKMKEIIRAREVTKKALRRQRIGKRILEARSHDDVDRAALKQMTGKRVTFTEREDAHILMTEIIKDLMRLQDKDRPLYKEHIKIMWRAFRDIIHKNVPESRDKTWNSLNRRARYMKKYYKNMLIVYKTCKGELEQNKEFMANLECTSANWKEKMEDAFITLRKTYSQHFNPQLDTNQFPSTMKELQENYKLVYAHKFNDDQEENSILSNKCKRNERSVRVVMLRDLIHNALTAHKSSHYVPTDSFLMFNAYPVLELKEAVDFYKNNRLVTKIRIPNMQKIQTLPICSTKFSFSNIYERVLSSVIPMKVFSLARAFYVQIREGKEHSKQIKEQDIIDMPDVNFSGTLRLNFDSILGGHSAFLISAIISKKVNMDYALPDEMLTCDESHLKDLNERDCNFQKITLEQRTKRGWKAYMDSFQKRYQTDFSNIENHSEDSLEKDYNKKGSFEKSLCLDYPPNFDLSKENENAMIKTFNEPKLERKQVSSSDRDSKRSSDCEQVLFPSENVTSRIPVICENLSSEKCFTAEKPENNLIKAEDTFNKKEDAAIIKKPKTIMRTVKSGVMSENENHNNKKVKFSKVEEKQLKYYGYVVSKLISCDKSLNCSFFSKRCKSCNKSLVKQFVYTADIPLRNSSKKKMVSLNQLKDTKLCASQTSLTFHRDLSDEQPIPTNTMNTHDLMVIKPLQITLCLKSSPYCKLKFKAPIKTEQKLVWQRFLENNEPETEGITTDEYCKIISIYLKLSEDTVLHHLSILKEIKLAGLNGISRKAFKSVFSYLPKSLLDNSEFHIQTMLNFNMIYEVGIEEGVFVAPMYVASWCYTPAQVYKPKEKNKEVKTETEKESYNEIDLEENFIDFEKWPLESTNAPLVSSELKTTRKEKKEEELCSENGEIPVESTSSHDVVNDSSTQMQMNESNSRVFKMVKVAPWLKLDGDLNGVLLKRFQECVLLFVLTNPGVKESVIFKHFESLLRPHSLCIILDFLVLNGCLSKHYQQKRRVSLFSSTFSDFGDGEIYYLPLTSCFLNMMDMNR
ncbi:general transcription factor 3C polypeptide 1 isoform X1 [Hydra vulgaris]|nr:general transcription factor 3C polypeptide 1 [Hydra vulgaris]